MVGLADLIKHFGIVKKCQMTLNDKYCYFSLSGVNTLDFLDLVNYKSWVYRTFQKMVNIRYVYIIKKLENGNTIVRTSVGFAPLLLRYLKIKGYQIRDEDIEVFRARHIVFPDLKIKLYDFQDRMVNDWLAAGSIGVLKAPTGSGKCSKLGTLILTDRGILKIEDIICGITDSRNRDKDCGQSNLYDALDCPEDGITDNAKMVTNVISISGKSGKFSYGRHNISGRYDMGMDDLIYIKTSMGYEISGTLEHKVVIIDKKGELRFKKLEDINDNDYIALAYNTNVFNEKLKLNFQFRKSKFDSNSHILKNLEYMNEDIARLLGYVISEGTDSNSLTITNYDKEVQDDIVRICEKLGIDYVRILSKEGCDNIEGSDDIEGSNNISVGTNISSVALADFVYYLGYRHGAKNKEVPWSILQADKNSQIAFIRSIFDGDGTVYYGESKDNETQRIKTKTLVEYYSSSYELCRQLQIMLLNMGIISRLNIKKGTSLEYRGEIRNYDDSFRLSMTGGDILKYAKLIGFGINRKKDILNKCINEMESHDRWTDIIYPYIDKKLKILYERLKLMGKRGELIKTWEEDFISGNKNTRIIRKKRVSSYEYLAGYDKTMWAYISGERFPSKETLEKILNILDPTSDMNEHKYLKMLCDKFIFDKVDKIKNEKENVYDITVDNVHSYIGNGIINHNTILACSAIKHIGRKTLILVHTSDLLINVWNESLLKAFGHGIMGQVGIVGGGLTDKDRVAMRLGVRSGDFDENVRKDIVIATFQTLMNRMDDLTQYKFGLMIVDECHHVPASMFRKVNAVIRAPYKLGLSATTTRLDGMEKDCFGQLGDIRSKVSIRELINRGILAEPRFQSPIIVDHEITDQLQDSGLSGLNYSRLVKKKSAASQKKKDYIVNICKNIAARDRKFLLFTDYVNAEDVFVRDNYAESLLKEEVRVSIIDQGMASDERSSVFNFLETGDISGIVFGKLGSEGVNIPSVDVVVMANAIKCVSGNILVPTDKGLIRAKDLVDIRPNYVLTIDPDNLSVIPAKINEFYNFDEEDTIKIKTIYGYEIEGSVNHMVVTGWSQRNIIYTPLSDIDIGNRVLIYGDVYNHKGLIFYDRIISKKKSRNKLYDINVDKYHSFIAGGFINHNSPITFTQRVGRTMRRIPGKDWCDVYEVLLDLPTEIRWSDFNFSEYRAEGFQKLVYKVE